MLNLFYVTCLFSPESSQELQLDEEDQDSQTPAGEHLRQGVRAQTDPSP